MRWPDDGSADLTAADVLASFNNIAFQSDHPRMCAFIYAPVTLILTRWPWHVNPTYTFGRRACRPKEKFLGQGFQKLRARTGQIDGQTDRRDRTHYHAAFAGGNKRQSRTPYRKCTATRRPDRHTSQLLRIKIHGAPKKRQSKRFVQHREEKQN